MKELSNSERIEFNKKAQHPLQSWEWGDFRSQTGVEVSRLTDNENLDNVYQITWHKVPHTPFCIGYCPKSSLPSEGAIKEILQTAREKGAIFVKFEPNVEHDKVSEDRLWELSKKFDLRKGKPLFTKYSFFLDISGSEQKILEGMHQKTRYNIRLAEKKGVKIVVDNTDEGFEDYWRLTEETTRRQGFYSHSKNYHRLMWERMVKNGSGVLMKAVYENKVLATWILFRLNKILYYPYGASSSQNRELMASNLMMWEAIKYGKKNHCEMFDMWGSLGPEPDTNDPWYGFHRFKQGYGGRLVEFVGTYDLVVNKFSYQMYLAADGLRWMMLKTLAGIRK